MNSVRQCATLHYNLTYRHLLVSPTGRADYEVWSNKAVGDAVDL